MINNIERVARFTSSQNSRLMGLGSRNMTTEEKAAHKKENPTSKARTIKHLDTPDSKFYSYVNEKKREMKLGRSLSLNKGNRSTAWGEIMEWYVVTSIIGKKWQHHAKTTTVHPIIKTWAGSPDLVEPGVKVGDIKCYEPDNFTKLADVLLQNDLKVFKEEYTDEYWQLVSNAAIHQVPKAEMILFMPKYSDLEKIRAWMDTDDAPPEAETWKYRFIFDAPDYELPYIPDECEHYQSLITFEFEVPQSDIFDLTYRIEMASKLLKL